MVNELHREEELAFGFESEEQRRDFARAFGIDTSVLPPVRAERADAAPSDDQSANPVSVAVFEPLSDAEWAVIQPHVPPRVKMGSKIPDREFLNFALLIAQIDFKWSLLRFNYALRVEANRKKISRWSQHDSGCLWTTFYQATKGQLAPAHEESLRKLSSRGERERESVNALRRAKLKSILTL